MELNVFQVDAFHEQVFHGNPAAVCPLDDWLPEHIMQAIAMENNLSETAFLVPEGHSYHIRWFTPAREVDLCGHATLAAAHVIFRHLDFQGDRILFHSRSGALAVDRGQNNLLTMDFPAFIPEPMALQEIYTLATGLAPREAYRGNYLMLVFDEEEQVIAIKPDFRKISELDQTGVIITARGKTQDFVSRFFAPAVGIDEDPVTGSAHCMLIPYWAARLDRNQLVGRQASRRGGIVYGVNKGERVLISGHAVTYMIGKILVED